jgi:XapX domain-containing protein
VHAVHRESDEGRGLPSPAHLEYNSNMIDALVLKALVTGLLTGAIFAVLNLPIPAPSALAGVLGIVGIFLGYVLVTYFRG